MNESDERDGELLTLADRLGFEIKDLELFDRALTHVSMAAETSQPVFDYESLEFLGDAVLGLVMAHHLLETMPERTPGEYSRMRAGLVNRRCVARVAKGLNIAPVIRLGKGEELSGGRQRAALMGDCLEALIGAIYLDSGWDMVRDFVIRVFALELDRVHELDSAWDFKSKLQNFCQSKHIGLPQFKVIRAEGPDHQKEFEIEVLLQNEPAGRGKGSTKKEAEQRAAKEALAREGQQLT
jgi:ribonuclease-3